MAAGGGDADSGSERAETYLRLRAEAELRRAQSFPRYRQPRQRRVLSGGVRPILPVVWLTMPRGSATYSFARTIGTVRAATRKPQSRRVLVPRLGTALPAVRQQVVFTVWGLRAHVRHRTQFSAMRRPPQAEECLDRVTRLAGLLANAGAISDQVRADVIGDTATALAARGLIHHSALLVHDRQRSGAAYSAASAATVVAIPVGQTTQYEVHGRQVRAYLGTLIVTSARTKLTVTARLVPSQTGQELDDEEPGPNLDSCTAIDDRGTGYEACFIGGGDGERWDGTLDFHQPPSAGARWLDVSLQGAAPVRIDMSARGPALPTTSVSLPDGAADRYLDRLTLDALVARRTLEPEPAHEQELVAAASDLFDAGLIAPGSAAHGRLVAAAELLDLKLPPQLADLSQGKLPDDWLVMLARWDSQDGPVGTIPVAARLPDLEGMRCVVTGIESDRESASVQVYLRGRPQPVHYGMVTPAWFQWTARDDGGCLYIAEVSQAGDDEDGADVTLQLHPAIRPQARTLTINLTGRASQVSVTVPLDWRVDA
jgi:hypothetical protein